MLERLQSGKTKIVLFWYVISTFYHVFFSSTVSFCLFP
jgi:hypothetical protein